MNPRNQFKLQSRDEYSRQHARLLARIHRRYQTTTEELTFGPLRLRFTRVADPGKVLDEVAAREDRRERFTGERHDDEDLHLPYWAELWESSMGLGRFLVDHWTSLAPRKVLDLGCGMGLAGCVAAALAAHVVLADLEPDALLFARLNSLPWRPRVRTRRVNWKTDNLDERFDLILGADVVYERAQWTALEPFWRRHLAPDGQVLIAEPGRQTGELFVEWIKNRGWSVELEPHPLRERGKRIRVMRLSPE